MNLAQAGGLFVAQHHRQVLRLRHILVKLRLARRVQPTEQSPGSDSRHAALRRAKLGYRLASVHCPSSTRKRRHGPLARITKISHQPIPLALASPLGRARQKCLGARFGRRGTRAGGAGLECDVAPSASEISPSEGRGRPADWHAPAASSPRSCAPVARGRSSGEASQCAWVQRVQGNRRNRGQRRAHRIPHQLIVVLLVQRRRRRASAGSRH